MERDSGTKGLAAIALISCLAFAVAPWLGMQAGALEVQGSGAWEQKALGGSSATWFSMGSSTPRLIFASVVGKGVYQSSTAGANWEALPTNGLTNLLLQAVAVCPSGSVFTAAWGSGVFQYDGGSWTQVNSGLGEQYITSLACIAGDVLFAGTYSKGIYKLQPPGTSWTAANGGLGNLAVRTIQRHDSVLFAGTASGAYKSTNQGANWEPAGLAERDVFAFEFHPTDPQKIWAAVTGPNGGVFATSPGGDWGPVGQPLPDVFAVARGVAGDLYAGTKSSGVYRYDAGTGWQPDGIPDRRVFVLLSVTESHRVLAGTADGIWAKEEPPLTDTPTPTPTGPWAAWRGTSTIWLPSCRPVQVIVDYGNQPGEAKLSAKLLPKDSGPATFEDGRYSKDITLHSAGGSQSLTIQAKSAGSSGDFKLSASVNQAAVAPGDRSGKVVPFPWCLYLPLVLRDYAQSPLSSAPISSPAPTGTPEAAPAATPTATATPAPTPTSGDVTYRIDGLVWEDRNGNRKQDTGE